VLTEWLSPGRFVFKDILNLIVPYEGVPEKIICAGFKGGECEK